jgi:CRP/FNR family transcriptional regulator, cyclic AMP receptor protein
VDPATLETIPLFAELTPDQRERVGGVCLEVEVEAGTTLLREGDFGYAMFAILDGTADVLKDGAVIRTLQRGDVFGEIAVLAGGTRTATVSARTPMRLVTVLNRDVWAMERETPEVGAALRASLAEHLARAG